MKFEQNPKRCYMCSKAFLLCFFLLTLPSFYIRLHVYLLSAWHEVGRANSIFTVSFYRYARTKKTYSKISFYPTNPTNFALKILHNRTKRPG